MPTRRRRLRMWRTPSLLLRKRTQKNDDVTKTPKILTPFFIRESVLSVCEEELKENGRSLFRKILLFLGKMAKLKEFDIAILFLRRCSTIFYCFTLTLNLNKEKLFFISCVPK